MRSTLRDNWRTLRGGCYRSEKLGGWSLVVHQPEGRLSVLPRIRPMSAVGTALRANVVSARDTLRAISKMGPRLRWPIHAGCGIHGEQVHSGSNGLLHQMSRSKGLERQHGDIHNKILVREHLVLIWLPHRTKEAIF